MSNKIFITGATGYLAGPLALYLSVKMPACKIILGTRNVEKLEGLKEFKNFEKRYFDIGDTNSFGDSIHDVNVIIHLAGMPAKASSENPSLAEFINTTQVGRLIDIAERLGVSDFIYFSTVHVYGAPLTGELKEGGRVEPVSVYAKTHYQAEKLVLRKLKEKTINGAILRLANIVAPPLILDEESSQLLVMSACFQAIKNRKIVLNGSGQDLRDFLSLRSLGNFVACILDLEKNERKEFVFNVCSGNTQSVLEIVKKIQLQTKKLFGYEPEIIKAKDVTNSVKFHINNSLARTICKNFEDDLLFEEAIRTILIQFEYMR
jgi:UDP-glucose 4-epimerase